HGRSAVRFGGGSPAYASIPEGGCPEIVQGPCQGACAPQGDGLARVVDNLASQSGFIWCVPGRCAPILCIQPAGLPRPCQCLPPIITKRSCWMILASALRCA